MVLYKDPLQPNIYKEVLVNKHDERMARINAAYSKKPGKALLTTILSLVFTTEELGHCVGLGSLKNDGKQTRLDCVRGNF